MTLSNLARDAASQLTTRHVSAVTACYLEWIAEHQRRDLAAQALTIAAGSADRQAEVLANAEVAYLRLEGGMSHDAVP